MKKSERIVLGFVLGMILPIVGFLAFWWSSIPFLPEHLIFIYAILGLIAGLVINICYLKKWIAQAYDYSMKLWMGIYCFYSVCILGFFMGVPVFNVLLAFPAGFFIGRKIGYQQANGKGYQLLVRRTCIFTTLVMVLVCLTSAVIALSDPYTGTNLQGMFHLDFEVTPVMIGWIIVMGGTILIGLQWWITKKMIYLAYRWTKITNTVTKAFADRMII